MSVSSDSHCTYTFGEFTLDLDRCALLRAGADIKLRPKSFDVLKFLVEHQGRLVTKEELLDAIWSRKAVTEDAVTHCLSDIRTAIDDQSHEVIRTVPRRGYIFEFPITAAGSSSHSTSMARWPRWALTVTLILALGAIAVWWWPGGRGTDGTTTTSSLPHSIAVLPFLDMSPEQNQAYLTDGIAEEILHLLARIPDLRVVSRSSAFSFKGKDIEIASVAQQLDVDYVLEGAVRRAGTQLRVTAQLIEARTDTHLWSNSYDRELDDVFEIQDEIAASVVDAFKVEVLGTTPRTRKIDRDVYILVLRARFFWNRKGPGDEDRAMEYYQRALDLDPGYAPAWAGLSASYLAQAARGQITRETGLAKAREAVEMALSLDPDLADAHVRMGILHNLDHDRESAFKMYEKALALEPNNPLAMSAMSTVWWDGRLDEAINWYRKAAIVDPLTTTWPNNMASLFIRAGRLDEAEEAVHRALDLSPNSFRPILNLAIIHLLRGQPEEALKRVRPLDERADKTLVLTMIYHALGRKEESDAALKRLTGDAGKSTPLLIAQAHAYRGEIDEAFEWLDRTNNAHRVASGLDEGFALFEFDPFLAKLRQDPRWNALRENLQKRH